MELSALALPHHCIFKALNRLTTGKVVSVWTLPWLASICDLEAPTAGHTWHMHGPNMRTVNPGSLTAEGNLTINTMVPCSTSSVGKKIEQQGQGHGESFGSGSKNYDGHWGIYTFSDIQWKHPFKMMILFHFDPTLGILKLQFDSTQRSTPKKRFYTIHYMHPGFAVFLWD